MSTSPDARAERIRVKAEQDRLNESARLEVERGRLSLDRQRHTAREQAKRERQHTRAQKRAALAKKINRRVPVIGRRVMIAGPILAPMSVAWIGQIQFATGTLAWPLGVAWVFAAAWELTTAFAGWMYHQARHDGDRGTLFRFATWLFAATAGGMNYWHALDGQSIDHPTPKAVSYGAMSLVGIGLWELYASLIHRRELRDRGLLPSPRPRFGVARWVRYPMITWTAWSLSIRESLSTVEDAWAAAMVERQNKADDKAGKIKPNAIPVAELATAAETEDRQLGDNPAPLPVANIAPEASAGERQDAPPTGDNKTADPGDNTTTQQAPARRQQSPRPSAKNRRSMDEWVKLTEPIFHAEFERLRRQPTGYEFAAAIKKAKLGSPSPSTAKNIRAEILDRTELPSLDDETTAEGATE